MKLEKYSNQAKEVLATAKKLSIAHSHGPVEPEHILLALCNLGSIDKVFDACKVKKEDVLKKLEPELKNIPKSSTPGHYLSANLLKIIINTEGFIKKYAIKAVEPSHFLFQIVSTGESSAAKVCETLGLTQEKLVSVIFSNINMTIKVSAKQDTVLSKYTVDLTEKARNNKLGPIIGRDDELRKIIQILCRSAKNNPILVGQPGVGKSALIEGLAIRIASGDVPSSLKNKKILTLDLASTVAGASLRGQFEERIKALVNEIKASAGNIILFVDEINTMVGTGGEGSSNASNMLKPALARGEIQMLGATTPDEYRNSIEKDKALDRRFQAIMINEPSSDETLRILRGVKSKFENIHGVKIQDPALQAAVILSKRYISSKCLPDKAIALIDDAAARLKIGIESVPQEIDSAERTLLQLKMEFEAIENDIHPATVEKKAGLSSRINESSRVLSELKDRWQRELQLVKQLKDLNSSAANFKLQLSEAEKRGDVENSSFIKYDALAKVEKGISTVEEELGKIQANGGMVKEEVNEEDIRNVVADLTGVPMSKMAGTEKDRLLKMEEILGKGVIGQKEAVSSISRAIRRSRTGLSDPNRPMGSFFFLGPSGVGKSFLAKTLAGFLFDDENNLIRLDMSEFMEKHTVSRLLGSPPGYKGSEDGGQLTEAVRAKPYSVVLFDEVEKAHPDIFNILLQVLDDGRLSDSQSRLVDFKNTVIIMTSNVGSKFLLDSTLMHGHITEEAGDQAMNALRQQFRPEFLGRIDDVIKFHGLTKEDVEQIALIQIKKIEKMLSVKNLGLEVNPEAMAFLIKEGFEPAYGARPLRRALQKHLQDQLATEVLDGKFEPGTTIVAQMDNGKLIFSNKK